MTKCFESTFKVYWLSILNRHRIIPYPDCCTIVIFLSSIGTIRKLHTNSMIAPGLWFSSAACSSFPKPQDIWFDLESPRKQHGPYPDSADYQRITPLSVMSWARLQPTTNMNSVSARRPTLTASGATCSRGNWLDVAFKLFSNCKSFSQSTTCFLYVFGVIYFRDVFWEQTAR